MTCILCEYPLTTPVLVEGFHIFYRCGQCDAYIRDPETYLGPAEEKERYERHNNDINDPRYQNFVSPITCSVMRQFPHEGTLGLDFGAGTGPVIASVLKEKGYHINLYDPFFIPDTTTLDKKYDYIVCCEVIEHFHQPLKEFELLKNLLKDDGILYCMTAIFQDTLDFSGWYYKNDPTHVIIYTEKTLQWIQEKLRFTRVHTENNRLVVFNK